MRIYFAGKNYDSISYGKFMIYLGNTYRSPEDGEEDSGIERTTRLKIADYEVGCVCDNEGRLAHITVEKKKI